MPAALLTNENHPSGALGKRLRDVPYERMVPGGQFMLQNKFEFFFRIIAVLAVKQDTQDLL